MSIEKAMKKQDNLRVQEIHFYAYETFCTIGISPSTESKSVLEKCRKLVLKVQDVLNIYDENSELSQLCRNYEVGKKYHVSELLFQFLQINLFMADFCNGIFDPTIGSVISLWEICDKQGKVPEEKERAEALRQKGYTHLTLFPDSQEVTIDIEGIIIHPGASGKGFALDVVMEYLKKSKVKYGYLNFGGNIYTFGDLVSGDDYNWKVGIKNPCDTTSTIVTIKMKDESLSTSAGYEHYFESDGQIYPHILETKNGKSVKSEFLSVSCLTKTGVIGDIFSTLIYIVGRERGEKFIRNFQAKTGIQIYYFAVDVKEKIYHNMNGRF